jgi:class 3 adenylate cyclase
MTFDMRYGTRVRRLLGRINLTFADPEQERAFIDYYVQNMLQVSRTLMFIGAFTYYVFFIADQVMDPASGFANHILRGTVAVPVMIMCAVLLFVKRLQRHYETIAFIYYLVPQTVLCIIYINMERGFEHALLAMILLLMSVNMTFTVRLKYTILITLVGFVSTILCELFAANAPPGWTQINVNYLISAIIFGSISAHLRERASRRRFLTKMAQANAQKRIDDLLHSMLPRYIAERMQSGETGIADSLGEVTIIFARAGGLDNGGNDSRSASQIKQLNRLFSIFDTEAERCGVDKIKTIGDTYMAVAGLAATGTAGDHAENAAKFALAIRAIVEDWNRRGDVDIDFRVGLHVGPIVAGVIGLQRPRFDCWGDSVNLASRLQTHAAPGEICISESSYWRLRQKFVVSKARVANLKGIGEAMLYRLERRNDIRPPSALQSEGVA